MAPLIAALAAMWAALWAMLALSPAAHADDAPAAMIIFDGSGSMWGRFEGEKKASKLDLARDALRPLLQKVPAGAKTGLLSFGHRRGGDCSDIEVLAPVASGDPARIITPLDKLNPRGKGPITGALREAAKALAGQTQSSIVLIHDNADNCRQDPCEAAAEIAAASPKLKIHLVSLGLDSDELERVACIAKSTGGTLYDVKDQAALATMLPEAMRQALPGTGATQPATPAREAQAARPSEQAPPAGPPGLSLRARLAANSATLAIPVEWRITKAGGTAVSVAATASTLTVPLEPGSYTVEAKVGFATATKTVTVASPGPTPVEVAMEAAALRVIVKDIPDGQAAPGALVTLTPLSANGEQQPTLWIGRAQDADFVLPAGTYKIRASESLATSEAKVVLAPGAILDQNLISGAGRLELTATAKQDGEPLDGVTFLVSKDDTDAPDGRREIARSANMRPSFVLPAGTYYVTARLGNVDVRQRIGVGAGDVIKRAVSMGLAKLTVTADTGSAKKDASSAAQKPPIAARILSLDGEPREIASSTAAAPEFTVAAGRYRVEAAVGAVNVKATQDIDVEPGANRRVAMKLDASQVALAFAPPATAGPAPDLTWELRDAAGALVLRSLQASPKLLLAPGRYQVRLDVAGQRLEKPLDITADGQPRTLEFALP
jgi:Ca-activated chloride channel homolog